MNETHAAPNSQQKPQDIMSYVNQLEGICDEYLVKKAPFSLPENVKDIIVKLAYPLAIIGAVLMAIAIVTAVGVVLLSLGISGLALPFAGTGAIAEFNLIGLILSALQLGVSILGVKIYFQAIPGLKTLTRKAWHLVYLGYLLSVVSNLLSMRSIGSIIFGLVPSLVGLTIGLYIWFQVKDRYTH
ncbi:MAG: hypothetical protein WCO78_00085 [Candidatus Roizmanbacteria bacterium]